MTVTDKTTPAPQSAAAPSPFPPIAEYAFISNCHTGALIAPDGAVDWLCVPSFDSPSAFGSLLDRQAGSFRLGPFGIDHPDRARLRARDERARLDLEDAVGLDRRPRRAHDGPDDRAGHDHPAHAPARRRRRRAPARAHGRVPRGRSRGRARLRAGLRLRASRLRVACSTTTGTAPTRPAPGRRSGSASDVALGIEGERVRGAARAQGGRAAPLRALVGGRARGARRRGRRDRAASTRRARFWRSLARTRAHPRPPLARPDPALRARDQGPDVHADRRHRRRAHDLAPRDARRRAQLGLPLHVDARLDVHAAGAALPAARLGGRRVHAVRRRRRAQRGRLAADHVRHRRPP